MKICRLVTPQRLTGFIVYYQYMKSCKQMLKCNTFDRWPNFVLLNLIWSRKESLMADRCVQQVTRIQCMVQEYIIVVSLRDDSGICVAVIHLARSVVLFSTTFEISLFHVSFLLKSMIWHESSIFNCAWRIVIFESEWSQAIGQCRLLIKLMQQPGLLSKP